TSSAALCRGQATQQSSLRNVVGRQRWEGENSIEVRIGEVGILFNAFTDPEINEMFSVGDGGVVLQFVVVGRVQIVAPGTSAAGEKSQHLCRGIRALRAKIVLVA